MYIHRIYSGENRCYRKVLLRRSYKEKGQSKNITLANLSNWSESQIELLESALAEKRQLKGSRKNGTPTAKYTGFFTPCSPLTELDFYTKHLLVSDGSAP